MSRPIKFRAWDKEREEMLTVKLMDFSEWWVSCDPTYGQAKPLDYGERNSFANQDTDRHILMQYIGLKDCKRTKEYPEGQEIYEKDIVRCRAGETYQGVSEYDAQFTVEFGWSQSMWEMQMCHSVEVIGNIYDNPDLTQKD